MLTERDYSILRLLVEARLYAKALGRLRGAPLQHFGNGRGQLARELGLSDLHIVPSRSVTIEPAN